MEILKQGKVSECDSVTPKCEDANKIYTTKYEKKEINIQTENWKYKLNRDNLKLTYMKEFREKYQIDLWKFGGTMEQVLKNI